MHESFQCLPSGVVNDATLHDDNIHSYRVCNGVHPSYSSILHSCNFVSDWYLPQMSTVCHNVADITCGRAAHTGFALPVAPQMLRCRVGSLSRAHSVGRPPTENDDSVNILHCWRFCNTTGKYIITLLRSSPTTYPNCIDCHG